MRGFSYSAAFALIISTAGAASPSAPLCTPFLFYRGLKIPSVIHPAPKPSSLTETDLLARLSALPGYEKFPTAYGEWKKTKPDLSGELKYETLVCIESYAKLDTDADGIPDWGAIVDGKLSLVLPPLDEDIDGDGTPNVTDPAPFDLIKTGSRVAGVPAHLLLRHSETARLQAELYRDFRIIAVDGSDDHSPVVLRSMLFLLRHGFSKKTEINSSTLRYLYATAGHDANYNIAAFHVEGKFISIGGLTTYPASDGVAGLETTPPISVLASLAHELGHAFLFSRLRPSDLQQASEKFGPWTNGYGGEKLDNFYALPFFRPHHESAGVLTRKAQNLVSGYALTGAHEWFAEGFAAVALNRIGMAGFLGKEWRSRLVLGPGRKHGYWANYNNVSQGFSNWLARVTNSSRPNLRSLLRGQSTPLVLQDVL